MSDDDLRSALERLLAGAPSDTDESMIRSAVRAGQLVVGNSNVTAGGDITGNTITIGGTVVHGESAEAMAVALDRLHPSRHFTLPPPPADFTGRQAELALILERAESSGALITGIRGLGGVGKTALALVVAHQLAPRYPDAALYLNLQGASDSPLDVRDAQANVIRAFHPTATIPEDPDQLAALYSHTLSDKSGVLLLDDARDASQVRPLLPPARWALLVTSRQHFSLPGILPLDLPELPMDDSRALLQAIAPRLADPEADEIAALCGRLPLALRLAASALQNRPALSPADYIRRLRDERNRIALLDSSLQLDPDQPGIEASLQISYDLLSPEEQAHWRLLAVFPSSFERLAAATIWKLLPHDNSLSDDDLRKATDTAADMLDSLSHRSLLEANASGRHRLHDLARILAHQYVAVDDELQRALRLFAGYYASFAEFAESLRWNLDRMESAVAALDQEWVNILAGQAWSSRNAAADNYASHLTIKYLVGGGELLNLRLDAEQRVTWAETAIASAQRIGDIPGELSSLNMLGNAYTRLEDFEHGIKAFESLGEQSVLAGDRSGEALAVSGLAACYGSMNNWDESIKYGEQARDLFRELGDRRNEARATGNVGLAYQEKGEFRKAMLCYLDNIEIAKEQNDFHSEIVTRGLIGYLSERLGLFDEALDQYDRALSGYRFLGDTYGQFNSLNNMANTLAKMMDFDKAVEIGQQALELPEGYFSGRAQVLREAVAIWKSESLRRRTPSVDQ